MKDEHLDQAIDHAVREMLDAEPAADLRARIMARVSRPVASGFGWNIRMAAVAAPAVLIIGLALVSPSRRVLPAGTTSARISRPVTAIRNQASRRLATAHPTARASAPRVERVRLGRPSTARAAVATDDETADVIGIAPLDPIAPIRVAAVTHRDIEPEPITVEPLAPIANLQVAPLTPSGGRH